MRLISLQSLGPYTESIIYRPSTLFGLSRSV
jgi:hypothetical protein